MDCDRQCVNCRHKTHATTDIPIQKLGAASAFWNSTVAPRVQAAIADAYGFRPSDVTPVDVFVVKYRSVPVVRGSEGPHYSDLGLGSRGALIDFGVCGVFIDFALWFRGVLIDFGVCSAESGGQRELSVHRDGAIMTFSLLLNSPEVGFLDNSTAKSTETEGKSARGMQEVG
eukprot:557778-Rhodomonas_salina.1